MMSKRQAAFREDYRTKIAKLYSGPAHVAVIYAIGLGAIWYFARHIHEHRVDGLADRAPRLPRSRTSSNGGSTAM